MHRDGETHADRGKEYYISQDSSRRATQSSQSLFESLVQKTFIHLSHSSKTSIYGPTQILSID